MEKRWYKNRNILSCHVTKVETTIAFSRNSKVVNFKLPCFDFLAASAPFSSLMWTLTFVGTNLKKNKKILSFNFFFFLLDHLPD